MKVRNGFVSNSSSSSFILGYKGDFHKVVPPVLKKWLGDYKMDTSKNVRMLTKKVQEDTYESMSDYKRVLINKLKEQADFWFENVSDYSKQIREEWKKEHPEEYEEHVAKMKSFRDNPILAAEKVIQKEVTAMEVSDKMLTAPEFLNEGYKVCLFDLEYSGDVADSNKFPEWRELHKLTDTLLKRMQRDGYASDKYFIDTDDVKIERLY